MRRAPQMLFSFICEATKIVTICIIGQVYFQLITNKRLSVTSRQSAIIYALIHAPFPASIETTLQLMLNDV